MIERGIATFGLDYGKCPAWLFERMKKIWEFLFAGEAEKTPHPIPLTAKHMIPPLIFFVKLFKK